jgi:glycosyltransferase involved in cell wall biosynthesis
MKNKASTMKMNLKILHTESHRGWGGQEIRVLSECIWMKRHGHQPLLAAPRNSQIYSQAKTAGLNVVRMSFTILTAISDFIRLRRLIKKVRPDVINTHGNMDAKVGLTAALGMKVPCVIRSRHHSHPVSPKWHNKLMYRHMSHYIFTGAKCVSDQLSKDLAVDPAKIIMAPSGIIPPDKMSEKNDAIRDLQCELKTDRMARFIGSVAMLRDWKGHRFILDAFSQISDRFPFHHLVIVGDGDEMDRLKRQREDLGISNRIHFTGFRDNPWPYYRAFNVKILASTKNELMSQVIPQAMFAGCPVIGTRVGGIPDIIEDGTNGLIAEPESASSLAHAIIRTLSDPKETYNRAENAFELVLKNMTIDAMGKKILGVYDRAFSRYV